MKRFFGLVYILLLLAAVVLGWLAWQEGRRATVLVEWTTASELDTAGFNLHRSESQEGPFIRINTALIPASSDPLVGSSYTYEDHQVQAGVWYYYQLEELELDGGSSYFGPISVQARGAAGIGYYLSLAVLAAGLIYGVVYLARRVLQRAGVQDAPAVDEGQ